MSTILNNCYKKAKQKLYINYNFFKNNVMQLYNRHLNDPGEKKYDFSHLTQDDKQKVEGPIQDDEALFFFSLVKVKRPKVIVEFGGLYGYSAINFLKALDEDGKLYSYDIIPQRKIEKRHIIYQKNLKEFDHKDIECKSIDIVFMDAHDNAAYKILFEKLVKQKMLSRDAIIAIHDTGCHKEKITKDYRKYIKGEGYVIVPGDREFVNWVKDKYPEFQIMNLHCFSNSMPWRHGLTIMQKYRKLAI